MSVQPTLKAVFREAQNSSACPINSLTNLKDLMFTGVKDQKLDNGLKGINNWPWRTKSGFP